MAIKDFSNIQYIKTIDTGEEVRIGGLQVLKNCELEYLRVFLFISNGIPTTERIRLKFYSDQYSTSLMFVSQWSNIYDIPNKDLIVDGWLGWIRIDFDRQPLNKFLTYYPSIELSGYTRVPGGYYIGVSYDYPFPIYDNGQPNFYRHPLGFQLFHYVDRANQ